MSRLTLGHWKTSGSPSLLVSTVSQLMLLGGVLIAIVISLGPILQLRWPGVVAVFGCYTLVAAMVVAGLSRHAPHRHFGLANSVTLTRASLTALLWGVIAEFVLGDLLILDQQLRWLLVLMATVALLSDGVDGWAARRSGMASDFGEHFDMEVDSLFLLALSILVHATGEIGAWVLASGMLRYSFVLAGYAWPHLASPLVPRWSRKAICVVQITVLIVALAPIVPVTAAQVLCLGGLALLAYSFAADFIQLVSGRTTRMRQGSRRSADWPSS